MSQYTDDAEIIREIAFWFGGKGARLTLERLRALGWRAPYEQVTDDQANAGRRHLSMMMQRDGAILTCEQMKEVIQVALQVTP